MARDELAPLALETPASRPRALRAGAAGSFPTAPTFVEESETS